MDITEQFTSKIAEQIFNKVTDMLKEQEAGKFVNGKKAAEMLHITEQALINYRKQGIIKGVKPYKSNRTYYSIAEIERLQSLNISN